MTKRKPIDWENLNWETNEAIILIANDDESYTIAANIAKNYRFRTIPDTAAKMHEAFENTVSVNLTKTQMRRIHWRKVARFFLDDD